MDSRFKTHPWQVIETTLDPQDMRFSESLLSLGNGYMGLRGNLEEDYSGDSHRGTYLGGVWFPDKTRVGWWKIGYPEYFGKAINAMNLIGLHVKVNGQRLDAGKNQVLSFRRVLDMQKGTLSREMRVNIGGGEVTVRALRFVSMNQKNLLAIRYEVACDFPARLEIEAYLDGNVHNEDSNYEETFWDQLDGGADPEGGWILARTKQNPFGTPRFAVAGAFRVETDMSPAGTRRDAGFSAAGFVKDLKAGETAALEKIVAVTTDRDYPMASLTAQARELAQSLAVRGFEHLLEDHEAAWRKKWDLADVEILGNVSAQQGIRFNLFHLFSTYTGEDARLNIGPKGFTGEKYGGATYWDTEAYCFPVILATLGQAAALQLLRYRHQQLPGAYHNARQQGLPGALYPMVTFNGIECHNEWEITFEEIHRNGAIAHAIWYYTAYTGDESYLLNEGLEVLLGIARFWAGRVHENTKTGLYMIHGVTGPNEYENNVNNNWYTNRIAAWCLDFLLEALEGAGNGKAGELGVTDSERARMRDISARMYYPEDMGVFIQHDTFPDKELIPASLIPREERPINQHWSWDRILRSCFIKQGDVLQGLYFLGHLYDRETKRRNFDFYEPMTVHESSLSPCLHSIMASELGCREKAMELYLRTARLDLDNVNRDTADGLHVTSMAGAWLAIAQGFAGMRIADGLSLSPRLPETWEGYAFSFSYRGRIIRLDVNITGGSLRLLKGEPLVIKVNGKETMLEGSYQFLGGKP
ncbi:MAG: family 65 glycosyl hydrolase domain-containing protein [Eubacteriales bacterium]|nr:family 65 glycosyl hydrolase domain-containing protein [Eubacteriales bacterium]